MTDQSWYSGVVVHGARLDAAKLQGLYALFVGWHQAAGSLPTHAGVASPSYAKKLTRFSTIEKQVKKYGFKTVESFRAYPITEPSPCKHP